MRNRTKIAMAVAAACVCGYSVLASAAQIISFDVDGTGPMPATDVGAFDWVPANALVVNGNPSGGIAIGDAVTVLAHSRMGTLLGPNGEIIGLPAGTEFTFVAGFAEVVTSVSATGIATFAFDPTDLTRNFFEIWTGPSNSNMLAGTGFNDAPKRIFYGQVTDAAGNFQSTSPIDQFDQSPDGINNYPGVLTVTGAGSTQISVQVISIDPDYFPGFGPTQVVTLKAFFNTSTVVPFKQTNPSALFVDGDAGADGSSPPAPSVVPNIGSVNGALQNSGIDLNFQLQADANQSFELGQEVPGACRVTYGGNDRNGNIDLAKFGQACSSDKGKDQNCYTFGGQVGAPTANPAFGGPFGEHTHHQVQGPAGDFVFHAGTHSAPKSTRITATSCKDPGACRQAEANAGFKQIDFEGTGSFRTLDSVARAYLMSKGAVDPRPDNQNDQIYYFRVDMNDLGEPGNKWGAGKYKNSCQSFFAADQNNPLATPDPTFLSFFAANTTAQQACAACPDTYQFYICKDENPCEQGDAIYAVRGFMTGGNIQLHKVIK